MTYRYWNTNGYLKACSEWQQNLKLVIFQSKRSIPLCHYHMDECNNFSAVEENFVFKEIVIYKYKHIFNQKKNSSISFMRK